MLERGDIEALEMSDTDALEILVVEDSLTQAMYLQKVLEVAGYKTSIAGDGKQALEFLEDHTPTLVISDVVMPEIDGYELCRRMKSDPKLSDIPVLLVTFLSDPGDILRGLDCGADNIITKPYQEDEVVSRVQYLLVNREVRRKSTAGMGMEIYFAGKRHFISAQRFQIVDLLISSFETAVSSRLELEVANRKLADTNDKLRKEIADRKRAQKEKERLISELEDALAQVKKLSGLIPICASCKRIRDDKGYWQQIEAYIRDRSEAQFSHGICPECKKKLYPDL